MKKTAFCLLFLSGSTLAADEIITIKSTITGSQEQPKVISIVPWQKPEDPNYFGNEAASLGAMPNNFQPMERKAFLTELEYISVMRKAAKK